MKNAPSPLRVVGVGSPQGDDAVGWEVLRLLQARVTQRRGIEFYVVDGGQQLLDLLDGKGTLLIIDAVLGADPPGTVLRLEWPEARLEALAPGSTHGLRPTEALQLAAVLGLLPSRVVIYGIATHALEPEVGLSQAVARALPTAVQSIEAELNAYRLEDLERPSPEVGDEAKMSKR